jgi:hypothetical protein
MPVVDGFFGAASAASDWCSGTAAAAATSPTGPWRCRERDNRTNFAAPRNAAARSYPPGRSRGVFATPKDAACLDAQCRLDFSLALAALMASSGSAISISFLRAVMSYPNASQIR